MNRTSAIFLTLLSAFLFFTNPVQAEEHKKGTPVKIGWVYAMANAPVLIAKQKGYFKEQGLDVEIIKFNSGPLLKRAISENELDLAYIGSPPVYHWYAQGLSSRILAKVNYGHAAVIARKDSGIKTLHDFKGKQIAGVRKGSGMDVLLRGYLLGEVAKLNPEKDLNIITISSANMGPAVEENIVSGAFTWEPFTSQSLLRGNTKIIFNMNKAIPKYPWYVIMATERIIYRKRATIIKVLRAHKKAVDFLNSSPTAGNSIIANSFHLGTVTDNKAKKYSANSIVTEARKRLGWEYELKKKDIAFIQRLMDYSYKLGFMNKKLKATEIIDTSLMKEALKK